jgi:hypothetical protein
MTVVFVIRLPWGRVRRRTRGGYTQTMPKAYHHRQFGPFNLRAQKHRCYVCEGAGKVPDPKPSYIYEPVGYDCPNCKGLGFELTPTHRRPYLSWAIWRFGNYELWLTELATVWHVDPDKGGDDDSCRRAVRTRQIAAYREGRPWANYWLWWRFRHMHLWCFRHWRIHVHPVRKAQRWLFTRCAHCGERFSWNYGPTTNHWDAPPHRWNESAVGLYHSECYTAHFYPDAKPMAMSGADEGTAP